VDDDAYISFRYARNLLEGNGLVYNPGERVEGYTNFLWVLLVAGGMWLGRQPETVSQALGLIFYAGTLGLTYRIARLTLSKPGWALATVLLVGTQFSVLSFATGGLETSLQTFLLLSGCLILFRAHLRGRWRTVDATGLSLVLAAGMLTRMDFGVFALMLGIAAIVSIAARAKRAEKGWMRALAWKVVCLCVPALVTVAAWLAWKAHYYGSVLPNTYYAKKPGAGAIGIGVDYLVEFCRSYRYWPVVALVLVGVVQLARQRHVLLAAMGIIVAWLAYLVRMGGGFIEFRFLVPVLPLFLLCVVWTVTRFAWVRRLHLHLLVIAWVAYGSLHHFRTYGWSEGRPEPVAHLRWQTQDALWAESGQRLHELFGTEDVVIATTVAGILPYHARLTTIDMHGLTDPYVARHSPIVSNRPGHKRLAGVDYMKQRGVNLVVGHPKIRQALALDELASSFLASCVQAASPAAEAVIVAIPITSHEVLMAWYLTRHPAIDRAIEERAWRTFHVRLR
jgi:arabinofuranosyltransferase